MRTFNTLQDMVAALNHTSGRIMDDHNNGRGARTVSGVAVLHRGDVEIPVSFIDAEAFCLNEIYLDEKNIPHVSTNSVGGVLYLSCKNRTLLEAIVVYNAESMDNIFSPSFISNVHVLEDGKLKPVDLVSREQVKVMQSVVKKSYEAKYGKDVA